MYPLREAVAVSSLSSPRPDVDVVLGRLHQLAILPLPRLLPVVLDRDVAPGLLRLRLHGAIPLLASVRLAPLGT
jgi:hypothetical protein